MLVHLNYQSFITRGRYTTLEMKYIFIAIVLFGMAFAALPSNDYLPALEDQFHTVNMDLQSLSEGSLLTENGYRYKTVKRLRFRHRREISELPLNENLPPVKVAPAIADIPIGIPIESPSVNVDTQESTILGNEGYHYKTVKRYRFRHRRDISERHR